MEEVQVNQEAAETPKRGRKPKAASNKPNLNPNAQYWDTTPIELSETKQKQLVWLCGWTEKIDSGEGYKKDFLKNRLHCKSVADYKRFDYNGGNTYDDWLKSRYRGNVELINEPK